MEYLFKLLMVAPKCLNGGERTMQGKCRCPKYFAGDDCSIVECINGGSLSTANKSVCVCSDVHYRGNHCEIVQCENGGIENGFGGCDCLTNWYTGKFCQFYSSSWSILFGCLGLLLLLALVYIACRWYCSFFNIERNRPRSVRVNSYPEEMCLSCRSVNLNGLNIAGGSAIPPLSIHADKSFRRSGTSNVNTDGRYGSAKKVHLPESPPPTYEEVTRMSSLLEHQSIATSSSANADLI
uniref:EGF-like domain-containing protein n=1 Tax=Trichuris muris TaxID=70415 RepID=A0A5S6Q842_TRIMR